MRRKLIEPTVHFEDGEAKGFYFRVPDAYRPALDIHLVERIDKPATKTLRERARAQGTTDKKSLLNLKISRLVWVQGAPPIYAFRSSDLLNTAGDHYNLAVITADPDTPVGRRSKNDGHVVFELFEHFESIDRFECTQTEFFSLLNTGRCARLNIALPDPKR